MADLTWLAPGPIVSIEMRFGVHGVLAPLTLLAFGVPGGVLAQTGVTNTSPFMPANSAAAAATAPSAGGLEFVAVVGTGAKTTVGIYDPATKKSCWIPVGGQANGIAVLSYDVPRDRIVIRTGGTEKALTLRKERGVQNGASPAMPPVVGLATPMPTPFAGSGKTPPTGAPTIVLAPASPTGSTVATTPGAKPPRAPIPADVAKKQEDERLLVSDLLEISTAQRKAYEDAQKQAAERAQTARQMPAPAPR